MTGSSLVVLPLDEIFALTPKARQEFRSSVTSLSVSELSLLLRSNGVAKLRAVRQAMPELSDEQFITQFKTLYQGGFLHETKADTFLATSTAQLRSLSLVPREQSSTNTEYDAGSFSAGLVWRRPDTIAARPAPGAQLTAVVVEDDLALSTFIQHFLTMDGFEVRSAKNRAQVVAALQVLPVPDVVLLDGTLPDVDGFDVLRKLRAHPQLCHVPALMLTGRATRKSVLQALTDGADGYLTKPFVAEALMAAVHAVTGQEPPAALETESNPWSNQDAVGRRGADRAPGWGLL